MRQRKVSNSLRDFEMAAIAHGKYTEIGKTRACNGAYSRVVRARQELRNLPDRGDGDLLKLIDHPNISVRCWAAFYLLPVHEPVACRALAEAALGPGLVAFSAGVTLKEWRAGRLEVQ